MSAEWGLTVQVSKERASGGQWPLQPRVRGEHRVLGGEKGSPEGTLKARLSSPRSRAQRPRRGFGSMTQAGRIQGLNQKSCYTPEGDKGLSRGWWGNWRGGLVARGAGGSLSLWGGSCYEVPGLLRWLSQ